MSKNTNVVEDMWADVCRCTNCGEALSYSIGMNDEGKTVLISDTCLCCNESEDDEIVLFIEIDQTQMYETRVVKTMGLALAIARTFLKQARDVKLYRNGIRLSPFTGDKYCADCHK